MTCLLSSAVITELELLGPGPAVVKGVTVATYLEKGTTDVLNCNSLLSVSITSKEVFSPAAKLMCWRETLYWSTPLGLAGSSHTTKIPLALVETFINGTPDGTENKERYMLNSNFSVKENQREDWMSCDSSVIVHVNVM